MNKQARFVIIDMLKYLTKLYIKTQQITTSDSEVFFSYPEVAEKLGVSKSATSHWVNRRSDFEGKYVSKRQHKGRYRKVVSESGLVVLMNMKGIKDRKDKKGEIISLNGLKGKMKIAEKVIKVQKAQTPLHMMKMMIEEMIEVQDKQQEHEDRIVLLEADNAKAPLTDGQRQRINERVRLIASNIQTQYSIVWTQLHEKMGYKRIHEYKFDDYQVAMNVLKEAFKQYNIKW